MNLLLMTNNGLPRNGLVALYDPYRDTYGRNILPVGSENFQTGWTLNYAGANIVITPNQPDPFGGNSAYRIQSSVTADNLKMFLTISGLSNPNTSCIGVWAKKLSTNARIAGGNGTDNPSVVSTSWSFVTTTNTRPYTSTLFGILTTSTSETLDILVYQPQVNLSTLYPYSPPAGLPQSLTDYTGHANNAQLGSTAGADTNDPAYSGQGLVFGADDYCKSSSPAFDDLGAFTVIAVIDTTNGTDERHFWDKQITIGINSIDNRLSIYSQCTSSFFVSTSTAAANVGKHIVSVGFKSKSDFLGFGWVDSIKQTFSIAAGTPTGQKVSDVANDLIIGNAPALNNQIGNIYIYAVYNRALTDAEYMQAYSYLKRLMSSRGITI